MSDFLDFIESFGANDAGERQLYAGEGRRARTIRNSPRYQQSFDETVALLDRVLAGDRYAALTFEEAMSTSDFPLLFGDVIDRALVGAYQEYPSDIEQIAKSGTVRDFRNVSRHSVDGAEGNLDQVAQGGEYPEASLSEGEDTFRVNKFGRILPFFWETFINDDLDAFREAPGRLGRAARRTDHRFITGLIADADGPHASLYTVGHNNIVNTTNGAASTNPALSIVGLQDAFTVLHRQTDVDGEPIFFNSVYLVVPPALEVTAQNILNATEIRPATSGGGTSEQSLVTTNWMKNRVKLIVDPYLAQVITTGTRENTSWFLFGDGERKAIEVARLRGHETPEIWVKSPNAMRVGGGTVGPDQGDFENDSIQYRVRSTIGGAQLNSTGGFRATVASNGTGS